MESRFRILPLLLLENGRAEAQKGRRRVGDQGSEDVYITEN